MTTEERMRELNMSFRNVPESTDVLTFPGPDWPGAPLGDIAVSMEFAKKGAAKRRVPVATELATLAVHGALHLLGFDDQTETDRADMVSRMNEVLALAGLPVEGDWSSQPHDGASD